ncbi:MAG: plasmid stabilization protein [Parvibaculaceae bacterium]
MASITIRNLDDQVKRRLRIRAAENGRSMEEEVREILSRAAGAPEPGEKGLGTLIHERFARLGGVELELPIREPIREPPDFSNFPE